MGGFRPLACLGLSSFQEQFSSQVKSGTGSESIWSVGNQLDLTLATFCRYLVNHRNPLEDYLDFNSSHANVIVFVFTIVLGRPICSACVLVA